MKFYFACSYSVAFELKWLKRRVKNVLVSYYALQKNENSYIEKIKEFSKIFNIFLDSGAFSSFTKKEEINIDKYIEFVYKVKEYIKLYAGLDVIGDWETTKKNIEYMESKGLNPLPTFHFKSPKEELERMIEKYNYIALGGLVPLATKKRILKNWLDYCFTIIKNKTKVHGFGLFSSFALKRYPFYSIDTTSWNIGEKFGKTVELQNSKLKGFSKTYKPSKYVYYKNLTWKERTDAVTENIIKLEKRITELWTKRGFTWKD